MFSTALIRVLNWFFVCSGWPVNVAAHPGWTGDHATSWRILEDDEEAEHVTSPPGPARYRRRPMP
jgi:hypothetical protein